MTRLTCCGRPARVSAPNAAPAMRLKGQNPAGGSGGCQRSRPGVRTKGAYLLGGRYGGSRGRLLGSEGIARERNLRQRAKWININVASGVDKKHQSAR